jgi:ATP-dependent DNA helicase RecG
VEYLTGISAQRGELLRKELDIHTFKDLLEHYPLRHIDKTKVDNIGSLRPGDEYAYVAGTLISLNMVGQGRGQRLVGKLKDSTGILELVWFQGINWVQKSLMEGHNYLVFGRLGFFLGAPQISHPDFETFTPQKATGKEFLEPIYPSTEKLKTRGLNGATYRKVYFRTHSKTFIERPARKPARKYSQCL